MAPMEKSQKCNPPLWLSSHLCLYQVVPLCADVFEETHDVDRALFFDLLQHAIQHYVGASPAYARTGNTPRYTI